MISPCHVSVIFSKGAIANHPNRYQKMLSISVFSKPHTDQDREIILSDISEFRGSEYTKKPLP